ncbi:response regulator, partial [archaeon]
LQVMQEYQKMWSAFQAERSSAVAGAGVSSGDGDGGSSSYELIIIAMSAHGDSATMEAALQAGADFFFTKPFDVEAFSKAVRKKKRNIRKA